MSQIDPLMKMRNILLLMMVLLLLSSCYSIHGNETLPPPKSLIDQEKVVMILADIEVAESALRQKQNHGHEIDNIKETYYRTIFNEYEVTREQFDSSMTYYKQDLDVMDKIYEEVITRLSVMESEIELE
jgi:hypothetical protein